MFKNILIVLFFFAGNCLAEQGILEHKIKLGMSNPLTGPTSQLGLELKKGSLIYFEQLNKQGGIHGRKVELISLDDGYEPESTIINTLTLIEQEQVFALFGFVGTPTSHAILPIIKQKKIPYLMPFTGADFLRVPVTDNIFSLRASYLQEVQTQINHLVKIKQLNRFALVIQADEFGLAAQRSYLEVLNQHQLTPIITERFRRNTNDIDRVLAKLKATPLDAVFFVGTYQPFTRLVNLGYEQGVNPIYSALSFVSSHEVFARLKYPSKVMISEVMPEPNNCSWSICQQFKIDMKSSGYENLNRVQLEGYFNAYVLSKVIKQCGSNLTRDCLAKKFKHFSFNDNQLNIEFTPSLHQGLTQTYLSFSQALKNE